MRYHNALRYRYLNIQLLNCTEPISSSYLIMTLGSPLLKHRIIQWYGTYLSSFISQIVYSFIFFFRKSRIDYYGGMVKTFQRGDVDEFGTLVKVRIP